MDTALSEGRRSGTRAPAPAAETCGLCRDGHGREVPQLCALHPQPV